MEKLTLINTVCYMCSAECGLTVENSGGQLKLKGNKQHPINKGKLCPKAALSQELRVSSDRLLSPLKRVGDRGNNKFVKITWEQAFREIASKLEDLKKQYGPEATTFLFGEKPDHDPFYLFAQCYGTPNIIDHNSLCDSNARIAYASIFGDDQERPLPDLQRPLQTPEGVRYKHDCKLMIIFGANPSQSKRFYWLWDGIVQAKKQGMKLIVVDPVSTGTTALADSWIRVIPGSDGALAFAVLRYLIEENIRLPGTLDSDFIEKYVNGWCDLVEKILVNEIDSNNQIYFTVKWAALKTSVDEETIVNLAKSLCETKPAVVFGGMNGISHHYNGLLTSWVLAVLNVITGNIDIPGGLHLRKGILGDVRYRLCDGEKGWLSKHKDLYAGHPHAKHGIVAKIPNDIINGVQLRSGPYAGHQYKTKVLFFVHHNPILTAPNGKAWIDAFTQKHKNIEKGYQLELLVANDIFLHDSACYADYVLPIAHYLERQGIVESELLTPTLSLREKVAVKPKDIKSPLEIVQGVAKYFGDKDTYVNIFNFLNDDQWCEKVLERSSADINLNDMRVIQGVYTKPTKYHKYKDKGFSTESKKIELLPLSITEYHSGRVMNASTLYYESPYGEPLDDKNRGKLFHLISGRSIYHSHSITQNLDCYKRQTSPYFKLSIKDCEDLNLSNGDRIQVTSVTGAKIIGVVEVDDSMKEGVLWGQHGWGGESPFLSKKISNNYNINLLMDIDNYNPVSGNFGYGDMKVAIKPI